MCVRAIHIEIICECVGVRVFLLHLTFIINPNNIETMTICTVVSEVVNGKNYNFRSNNIKQERMVFLCVLRDFW